MTKTRKLNKDNIKGPTNLNKSRKRKIIEMEKIRKERLERQIKGRRLGLPPGVSATLPESPRSAPPAGPNSAPSSKARSESPTPSSTTIARTTLLLEAELTKERALVHGSCTDSWHDFHTKKGYNTTGNISEDSYGLYDTKYGIPIGEAGAFPVGRSIFNSPDSLHTEVELLQELFKGYELPNPDAANGQPKINLCESAHPKFFTVLLATKLEERLKKFQDGYSEPEPFTCPSIIDGVAKHDYDIKMLHKKIDRGLHDKLGADYNSWGNAVCSVPHMTGAFRLTADEIIDFFGASEINLLFDAGVVNVVSLIRNCNKGEKGAKITVNRLINRELINDPAPKTYEFNSKSGVSLGAHAGVVEANILFDDETEPVRYTKYTEGFVSELHRGMFYSKYDFSLGKLQNGGDGKKRKKNQLPSIKLDIMKPAAVPDEDTTIYFSDNPHEHNNIKFCWNLICNIGIKDTNPHEIAAVAFQCKRSGDWLQALSCFDLGRRYVRVAKATKVEGDDGKTVDTYSDPEEYKLKGNNIILVTHDRVLLYYALLLGLDVLFTYKKPGVGAGDEDDEKEEEGEEEDDETKDELPLPGADGDVSKSKKYIIYFSNRSRQTTVPKGPVLSPAELEAAKAARAKDELEKSAALLVKTKGLVTAESAAIVDFINSHNGFVDKIIEENEQEIIQINENIVAATDVTIGVPTISLVQSYVKLASFNYKCVDGSKYTALVASVKAAVAPASEEERKKTDAMCREFISAHEGFINKQKMFGTKEQILEKTKYYRHNEHFKNIEHLSLTAKRTGGRDRKPNTAITCTPETSFLLMATYFVKNLAPKHLSNLVFDIKVIHGKLIGDEKNPLIDDPSTLYTYKFINNLESLSPVGSLNAERAGPDAVGSGRCALAAAPAPAAAAAAAAAAEKDQILNSLNEKLKLLDDLYKEIDAKIRALPVGSPGMATILVNTGSIDAKRKAFTKAINDVKAGDIDSAKALISEFDNFYKEKQAASDDIPEPEVPVPIITQVTKAIAEEQQIIKNVNTRISYFDRNAIDAEIINAGENTKFEALLNVAAKAQIELEEEEACSNPDYKGVFDFLTTGDTVDLHDLYNTLRVASIEYPTDDITKIYSGENEMAARFSAEEAQPSDDKKDCNEIIGDRLFAKASESIPKSVDKEDILKLIHMAYYYYDQGLKATDVFPIQSRISLKIQKIMEIKRKLNSRGQKNTALNITISNEISDAKIDSNETEPTQKLSSNFEKGDASGKKITFLTTLGSTLHLVGFKMLSAAKRLMATRAAQKGGGTNDTKSHLLVMLFLRQLIMDINSFDSSKNEDYKYYQGLAALVIAVCKVKENVSGNKLTIEHDYDEQNPEEVAKNIKIREENEKFGPTERKVLYKSLQACFYDFIPSSPLFIKPFAAKEQSYLNIISFICRNVALQGCGYSSFDGPIPSMRNISTNLTPAVIKEFNRIKTELKGKPFIDRVAYINMELSDRIITYGKYVPNKVEIASPVETASESDIKIQQMSDPKLEKLLPADLAKFMRLQSSVLNPNNAVQNFSNYVRKNTGLSLVAPVAGGKKTRKLKRRRLNKTVRKMSLRGNKKK
jgi:hypothetical protein